MFGRKASVVALCALLLSCSDSDERFVDTYTDVLVVRMKQQDSAQAQRDVLHALSAHGYTEEEFRHEFFERARQPERLRILIDSARVRAARRTAQK
ncbi:MAG: hypothetical protein N2663_04580 [Chlorobi bacterium]|nr:hypothetical protein [Chlorobiota bacterium]